MTVAIEDEQDWPTYRPSIDDTLMHCAYAMAARGTCARAYVGAVFSINGRIVSSGYNGAPTKKPHCVHHRFTFGTHRRSRPLPDWVLEWSNHTTDDDHSQPELSHTSGTLYLDNGVYTYSFFGNPPPPPCDIAIHAEQNAISFAALCGIALKGSTLYSTVLPCQICARLVISTGAVRVVAAERRENPASEELLLANSVEVTICSDVPEVGSVH